jgi:hypothetical protein
MRTSSLLVLFCAFVIGWVSAKLIGQYAFVADVPRVVDDRPRTKILVAKTEIPVGIEILAEHVSYVDVPVAELPARAIKGFGEVYRRKPAFPIPVNCPLCEDLLIAKDGKDDTDNATKFIPAGYTIVSLDVEFLNKRQSQNLKNNDNNDPTISLPNSKNTELGDLETGQILKKGNHVDIRVIAKRNPKGTFATIKEQVIQNYACKFDVESVGNIVLEDVPIHSLKSYGYDADGNDLHKVSFLLDESKVEQLANAAKKGRLRIVTHRKKIEPPKYDDKQRTETTITAKTEYKGFKSYIKEVKNTTTTAALDATQDKNLTANNKPEKVEPTPPVKTLATTSTNNNPEKLLPTGTKTKLQSPSISTSESITVVPPFWGLPVYLRNLYDFQSQQNTVTNTKTTPDSSITKIEKPKQETANSATSPNLKDDLKPTNKSYATGHVVNNSPVFIKPQAVQSASPNILSTGTTENIKISTEPITNEDAGWSNTGKYTEAGLGNRLHH